ncbi:hypothetical protein Ddye_018488 [Dipteronia dyeriana]|uniref:Uncharacterized protein n=1 Tax=Dipteronia dyeriana TaxID=168575 RepID=A0AAD9X0V4_9ROSI|nr:hypothetical protein Ddye_018488 [Dipteronia dyeriana]
MDALLDALIIAYTPSSLVNRKAFAAFGTHTSKEEKEKGWNFQQLEINEVNQQTGDKNDSSTSGSIPVVQSQMKDPAAHVNETKNKIILSLS